MLLADEYNREMLTEKPHCIYFCVFENELLDVNMRILRHYI